MRRVKPLTLSLSDGDKEKAKVIAMKQLGKPSISSLFAYLINQYDEKGQKK